MIDDSASLRTKSSSAREERWANLLTNNADSGVNTIEKIPVIVIEKLNVAYSIVFRESAANGKHQNTTKNPKNLAPR